MQREDVVFALRSGVALLVVPLGALERAVRARAASAATDAPSRACVLLVRDVLNPSVLRLESGPRDVAAAAAGVVAINAVVAYFAWLAHRSGEAAFAAERGSKRE